MRFGKMRDKMMGLIFSKGFCEDGAIKKQKVNK